MKSFNDRNRINPLTNKRKKSAQFEREKNQANTVKCLHVMRRPTSACTGICTKSIPYGMPSNGMKCRPGHAYVIHTHGANIEQERARKREVKKNLKRKLELMLRKSVNNKASLLLFITLLHAFCL